MLVIKHRANTIEELLNVEKKFGVEIDLRVFEGRIIVQHDPYVRGVNFDDWLNYFKHSFCILNIKEEGIEVDVLAMLQKKNISNFFLLDLNFHKIIQLIKIGEIRISVRISKYESIYTAAAMAGKVEWVWVDMFDDNIPLTEKEIFELKKLGFKLCLVSPDVHGRLDKNVEFMIEKQRQKIMHFDAVCAKTLKIWEGIC